MVSNVVTVLLVKFRSFELFLEFSCYVLFLRQDFCYFHRTSHKFQICFFHFFMQLRLKFVRNIIFNVLDRVFFVH